MEKLLIFGGMALVTFITRYAMIAVFSRDMPRLLRRWLAYVPPAILAAVIAPAVLMSRGSWEIGPQVWAMVVGGIVVWRTRSILLTILCGMTTFWLLRLGWG